MMQREARGDGTMRRTTSERPSLTELLGRLEALGRPPVDPLDGDLATLQAWVRERQAVVDALRARMAGEALEPTTRRLLAERIERLAHQDQAVLGALRRRHEQMEAQVRRLLDARAAIRGYGGPREGRSPAASVDRQA